MKYVINSVPGFADAGVPHGDGGWSQDATTMSRGVRIKFQMTNFIVPLNKSFMKYALKSVPGLADVGVLQGDGDGPRTQAPGSGSKIPAYHVDQRKKLKEWNG